ncbi:MAG: methyltransferase [Verrucomicrobia bacterium]|nr:methyltransferase [Verrucomicrobiota bacterium]MBU4291048.1 methyltransferase [Verrucomicrobiota bacterium]MBU4429335.1 methyltransferase [Verrucomicrobiota bacterium]MBU4498339.1 methyltransferase [Verrucomicrobiota bacterium]MCG2679444.1 methyltransferase [Kiritimatiellia bacterium]
MTSNERVRRVLTFEEVDRIPIENGFEGELQRKYPSDVAVPPYRYPAGKSWGEENKKGSRMDIWGCLWEAGEDGVCGEVKDAPLRAGWEGLKNFRPPWGVLEGADLSPVNPACAESEQFMISMWDSMPNPFERMQHLRGSEQLFLDLAYLEPEIYQLRDMLHEYFLKQMAMWAETDIDAVHISDDWGAQQSLLISPDLWRTFFKPLYRDYCDAAHAHGKYVLMHSDGYIRDIIPDLIEIGVNAINAQLFCMPIEALAEEFAGRICFWGEIDRQRLLTSATPQEVREAVRRVAGAFLKRKRTGIVGQCFWGKDHRIENCEAVYDEWSKV